MSNLNLQWILIFNGTIEIAVNTMDDYLRSWGFTAQKSKNIQKLNERVKCENQQSVSEPIYRKMPVWSEHILTISTFRGEKVVIKC